MLKGEIPPSGVQKGQRWLREDPGDNSKLILEITTTSEYDARQIRGIIVQSLEGKAPYKSNDHWTSDLKDSPCYYTYLQGQDNPS
jgi:hypothetical protein